MALVAMGCDLATFALDPKPRFEETWNLPATSNKISVADLLPAGNTVSIYSTPASTPPDSIAFALTISPASISRVVGADCIPCGPISGTNAIKPPFTLNAGNSTPLPNNVVSAAILSGQIVITLTNNLSFDPLFVKTGAGTQGRMEITVRSGSLVLGRDSVTGAAAASGTAASCAPYAAPCKVPFPKNGGVLTRTISLVSGTVTGTFTVDVLVDSPVGDHLEFINANATFNASAAVNSVLVGAVSLNVPSSNINSGSKDTVDLKGITGDAIKSAGLEMTFTNPFAVTGNLTVQFKYGPNPTDTVYTGITLPTGSGKRTAVFNETQIQKMLGHSCAVSVTGSVTSAAPITVTPKQALSIDNRLLVTVRTPSGGGN